MTDSPTTTTDLKLLQFSSLKENQKELEKLKIFPKACKYNTDFLPTQATYRGYSNYVFCTTKITELELRLAKFTKYRINIDGVPYFPIRFPADEEIREELFLIFHEAEIGTTSELTISWDSNITAKKNEKDLNMPRLWREKIHIVRELFDTPIKCTIYRPLRMKKPYFPLYVPKEKTAEAFIKQHNAPAYTFYYNALMYHVAFSSGIIGQHNVNKIAAFIKDIKPLLPKNLTFDKLLSISNYSPHKIYKSHRKLLFVYDLEQLNALHSHTSEKGSIIKHQRINIPIKFLPQVFKAESFGKNGTAYFLALVFGYHCRHTKVNYKPSTLAKLCHINTSRGIAYTLQAFNKPLEYMKKTNLLDFEKITKESFRADKPIKIELFPLMSPLSQVKF